MRGRVTVRSNANQGVLSGIVRCDRCGGPTHTYHYYCLTRRDLKTCEAPNSRAPLCDALAIDVLRALAIP